MPIHRVGAESFDWVGTSLGGLMGIVLAGVPNSPIRRLVVNDIAPEVPTAALQRLALYRGRDPRFPNMAAVEAHLRETLAPFGPMTDADWRRTSLEAVTRSGVDGIFGDGFFAAVSALPAGEWGGPVMSGYGAHLVQGQHRNMQLEAFAQIDAAESDPLLSVTTQAA